MNKVTTSIYLDTRREKNDRTFPVQLRLTYQRKRKYYSIGYSLSKNDYDKTMNTKPRGNFKDLRLVFDKIEREAIEIINKIPVFSFISFENKYLRSPGNHNDLFFALSEQIKKLKKNDQINTASTYEITLKSWKTFYHKDKLLFDSITPDLLNDYEKYMISLGRSMTTISINARNIRRLFNLAIYNGDTKRELYPFGKKEFGLYQIPQHQNIKKALSKTDLKKLFDYNPEGSTEHFCLDLWIFSYLCNGLNMADILRLTYNNIQGNTITFIRQKTAHNRKTKHIMVEITPYIQNIITKWGTKPVIPGHYVFNILSIGLNAEQKVNKTKQATNLVNTYIKKIARKLGITDNISTYTARHTYATILKNAGEPIAFISEQMGHANIQTTQSYLASFGSEQRKRAAKELTDFSDIE